MTADNLTDAQKLIADVARQHQQSDEYGYDIEECRCGERFLDDYADHLAREVDEALGGLVREISKATRSCSYPGSDGPCVGKHHGRFVGGWTPEETPNA